MRFVKRKSATIARGELTPMIDMTFQLIAFFMVLLNFTEAEQDQQINLPSSQLAKPPDQPFEQPLTIQLRRDGTVLFASQQLTVGPPLQRRLITERQVLQRTSRVDPDAVTVVIRADANAKAGQVQQIMRLCQQVGFPRFVLRAKQKEVRLPLEP